MGKSLWVEADERYPSLRRNEKKSRKFHKTKTRCYMTSRELRSCTPVGLIENTKADMKLQRRLKKKTINKSRNMKRQLKNMESGIRTPVEEERAYYEVEDVLFYIQMDGWLNENLETFTRGFPMIPKEYWLSLRYYR